VLQNFFFNFSQTRIQDTKDLIGIGWLIVHVCDIKNLKNGLKYKTVEIILVTTGGIKIKINRKVISSQGCDDFLSRIHATKEAEKVSISSTFYAKLLHTQIPKAQKVSQVISLFWHFLDLRACFA